VDSPVRDAEIETASARTDAEADAVVDDRLPTELWLLAHLRRCSVDGMPATVIRRGDPIAGTVLVKLYLTGQGCRILTRITDLDGKMAWMRALDGRLVPESEADAYIARQSGRDPDLWVVEIEDREGRHPFDGRII
jgi:hypothetical protein